MSPTSSGCCSNPAGPVPRIRSARGGGGGTAIPVVVGSAGRVVVGRAEPLVGGRFLTVVGTDCAVPFPSEEQAEAVSTRSALPMAMAVRFNTYRRYFPDPRVSARSSAASTERGEVDRAGPVELRHRAGRVGDPVDRVGDRLGVERVERRAPACARVISSSAGAVLIATGMPAASASATGRPKPSSSDGCTSIVAEASSCSSSGCEHDPGQLDPRVELAGERPQPLDGRHRRRRRA